MERWTLSFIEYLSEGTPVRSISIWIASHR
jgi:hypothetical protein